MSDGAHCRSIIDIKCSSSSPQQQQRHDRLLSLARIVFELGYGLLVPVTMRVTWRSSNDYLFTSSEALGEFGSLGMRGVAMGHGGWMHLVLLFFFTN